MRIRLALLSNVALLVAACGGGGGGSPPPATTSAADVRVTSTAPSGDFFAGSTATYSMTLSNAGPDAASNLTVQNVVGPGQTLSSITCAASGGAACPAALADTMSIGTLPNGGALTFSVNVSVLPGTIGTVSNTLHVSATGDPITNNNVATVSANARIPTSPQSPSFVTLVSDTNDHIGDGRSYSYDRAGAIINVATNGGRLEVSVSGNQSWFGTFEMPSAQSQLSGGSYAGLKRYPFHDAAVGGMSWTGEGRGCNTLTGSLTIDSATYVAGSLALLDLRFEQHCEGGTPALRGQIHWNANDNTLPPGPVNPPPTGLWSPAVGTTPTSGNYIYLQSDAADYIGDGGTYTYTQSNAVVTITATGGRLSVAVVGSERWNGEFQGMNPLSTLQPGYYGNLQRHGFHNPTAGGFSWSGEGRGCNELDGWVAIDSVTYSGTAIAALDLRFEQHCEGAAAALRGRIHWIAGDPTQPAGPQVPPPAGLWTPAAGTTPTTGNYVYFESQAGDYVGDGDSYTYTQANSVLSVTAAGARLHIDIEGDERWHGDFEGMNTLSQLQPGYYGGLQRFPFSNPVFGGLSVTGAGRGCNALQGWFVVDAISFSGGSLASVDLRFEQHCEGAAPALRGRIHWAAGDPTQPPGPQNPPPANLWAPAPGSTPASGNFVYLVSDAGDFIGQGREYTYTAANAILNVSSQNAPINVFVTGDEDWSGEFAGSSTLAEFVPGYYGGLHRYSMNPATGGLSWSGDGRGCNKLNGWFVIDSITYDSGAVSSVDMRFEQSCDDGGTGALRGKIHWDRNDPTLPPGPQNPPPSNLWAPAPGATPATGNYVYLQSVSGDYLGQGQTSTATPANASISVNEASGYVTITADAPAPYGNSGEFKVMNTIGELRPGYYPGVQRYPFHNPTKGGLDWRVNTRACNRINGWVVVDSVTYSAGTLASLDLRFEARCDGSASALHGKVHWIR